LEALEDKLSLLILILSNSILSFELVILHGLRIIEIHIFRVEHVGAEIEYCSLVDFCCLVLGSVDLRVELDEVTDSLDEIAALFLGLEVLLLREIGKTDQEMHED
jgi:hypothetical protein